MASKEAVVLVPNRRFNKTTGRKTCKESTQVRDYESQNLLIVRPRHKISILRLAFGIVDA